MQTATIAPATSTVSNKSLWAARIIGGIGALFMIWDGAGKIFMVQPVVETSTMLGIPLSLIPAIGVIEIVLVALFLFPRTALLGAVLLTGFLGGPIAIHLRAGSDVFSVIFPIIMAAFFWGPLLLTDARLRELFPIRR